MLNLEFCLDLLLLESPNKSILITFLSPLQKANNCLLTSIDLFLFPKLQGICFANVWNFSLDFCPLFQVLGMELSLIEYVEVLGRVFKEFSLQDFKYLDNLLEPKYLMSLFYPISKNCCLIWINIYTKIKIFPLLFRTDLFWFELSRFLLKTLDLEDAFWLAPCFHFLPLLWWDMLC